MIKPQLLVICGPTATGKTSLGIYLAKKYNAELVSADSRQVYIGMDIGTGKDIPQGAKWHLAESPTSNLQSPIGFWETKNLIKIWGYDLVSPKDEFSVAHYTQTAEKIIKDIWKRGRLPILVGGTGFYIKSLVDGISTTSIPRDHFLRQTLTSKKASELFEILANIDPVKAASLNISDRNNPRRLTRAIEVGKWKINHEKLAEIKGIKKTSDILFLGLKLAKSDLDKRIEKRVAKRINNGLKKEIKKLIDSEVSWEMQSMQSLGYKQWKGYFENGKSEKEAVEDWKMKEKQYAKRQLTWFKRDKRIVWFDIGKKDFRKSVEKLVKKWYNSE